MEKTQLNLLRARWTVEDAGGVGRAIFEAIPNVQRPDWVASIVLFVTGEEFLCSELETLPEIALDKKKWDNAKRAFEAIRKLTLKNEKAGRGESREQLVLDIGETAAKVIYNASGAPAPFDYDAGWYMAPRVKRLVDENNDKKFDDQCWRLLIRSNAA
jgi:hypothetical protein